MIFDVVKEAIEPAVAANVTKRLAILLRLVVETSVTASDRKNPLNSDTTLVSIAANVLLNVVTLDIVRETVSVTASEIMRVMLFCNSTTAVETADSARVKTFAMLRVAADIAVTDSD